MIAGTFPASSHDPGVVSIRGDQIRRYAGRSPALLNFSDQPSPARAVFVQRGFKVE